MDQAAPTSLPDLVLWRGDGCHLCDEARELVRALLAERAASGGRMPALVERRIADDPAVERELFEQIPVLEYDGRRLPLAIRAAAVRAFLAPILEDPTIAAGPGSAFAPETVAGADVAGLLGLRAGGSGPRAGGGA